MEKVVTFGIAAYNAEWCIEKCLNSFLEPSIFDKIEVIVVDDGSIDGTNVVVQRFIEQYPQVFQLISQENGGHGAAINTAVNVASGIYFKAVDSDDWVITSNLIDYVSALEKSSSDVVINSYHTVDLRTGKRKLFSTDCKYCELTISMEQLMEVYDEIASCCSFHGITYRLSVYRQAQVFLSKKIFYEDNEYAILPFSQIKTVQILPFSLYQYQIGDANQSVAFHNQVKRINQIAQVIDKILDYRGRVQLTKAQNEYFSKKSAVVIVSYYAIALVKNKDKKNGKMLAKSYHKLMEQTAPEINHRTEKKYRTLLIMNMLHLPASVYQYLLGTSFYKYTFRRLWAR